MDVVSVAATPIRGRQRLAALFALIALAACGTESPVAPIVPDARTIPMQPLHDVFTPEGGTLSLGNCRGAAGTYTYHVDVQGGGAYILSAGADRTFTYASPLTCDTGALSFIYVPTTPSSWLPGAKAKIKITQTSRPAQQQVDSVQIYINHPFDVVYLRNYVTVEMGFNDNAITFWYMGHTAQGCGTGYWKQPSHYAQWAVSNHTPTQTLGSLFAKSSLYSLNNKTLAEALAFGGGSSTTGAAQILLRAAVAAELNSRRPQFGYPIKTSDLVKSVDYALSSNNRTHMLTLAIVLEILNNIRCPLK